MKPRRSVLKILLASSLALLVAALAAYYFPQEVLTLDSGAVKAEAMVVLGGGTLERPQRATELFKAGEAPLIICSGLGDAESNAACLTNSGVPVAAILLEPKSHTTQENAKFSIAMLRALGIHRVIIVTTWYHSRRALMCFEHYAPDITFYSRPSYFGYPAQTKAETLKSETLNGKEATPHPTLSPVEAERARAARKYEQKVARSYAGSEYLKLAGYWACYGVCPF
jgi:uncharacterized SAM-binding protein YcdF (DUF218 family)